MKGKSSTPHLPTPDPSPAPGGAGPEFHEAQIFFVPPPFPFSLFLLFDQPARPLKNDEPVPLSFFFSLLFSLLCGNKRSAPPGKPSPFSLFLFPNVLQVDQGGNTPGFPLFSLSRACGPSFDGSLQM